MSRLPARLQPWWPLFKRVHRLLSLLLGIVNRRLAPLLGERGVPRSATNTSADTERAEPGSVVLHAGGPVEDVRRRIPPGSPPRHWRFVEGEQARIPARSTLEVAGGRLVGDFAATVTRGHRLDYQTSGYFGITGWREHPLYLSPTLGTIEHVPGTLLSLGARGASVNYYHFLYDAIGRYGIFEEALPGAHIDAVAVPHQAGYQRALLDLLGVPARLIQPRPGVTLQADRLLVPSTPNQDLDAPPWVVSWLRARFPPSGSTQTPGPRLYLTRGDRANTRRYVQEPELWPWLAARGFVRVDAGTMSVQEQIDMFHAADVVVAPHGAALTNITFCRPGTKVLEMFAPTYVHLGLWTIADAVGLDYRYLVGDGDHRAGRPMRNAYADVDIPAAEVQEVVGSMLR